MKYFLSVFLTSFLGVIPCSAKSISNALILEPANTKASGISEEMADSLWLDLYYYTTKNGKKRLFFEMYGDNGSVLCSTDNGQDTHEITLYYDRYNSGENDFDTWWHFPFYYIVSPDGRYLYIVTHIHAQSDGWVTEYQLFKIDCETQESEYIIDCAAIEATEDGFTVAEARLANEDTAKYTYQEIWVMHDRQISWEGKTISIYSREYDDGEMAQHFKTSDGHLVKGFQRHIHCGFCLW